MTYLHTPCSKYALPMLPFLERQVLILANGENRLADIIRILDRPAKHVFSALRRLRALALVAPLYSM